jgi:tRNA/tmRNA/rRNA uracil-C5-methylase (TrmA/RlmC/RlmD family)
VAVIPEVSGPAAGQPVAGESLGEQLVVGPVVVGPVAHGGHCVARHETEEGSRVIFVRHALPGEQVLVAITDTGHERFWRGDAVEIIESSPDRVPSRCSISGPGGCGGCDFQHVSLEGQRRLKTAVVAEQLERLAGISWAGAVEPIDAGDGLGWRTRMRFQVTDSGRAGLRAHRSHEVLPLPPGGCPIAAPAVNAAVGRSRPAGSELQVAWSGAERAVVQDGAVVEGPDTLVEHGAGRDFAVAADGFWQVHPAAADTLVGAVLAGTSPAAGERAFDLYCGVGLFSAALADAGCRTWGVESDPVAVDHARRNVPGGRFSTGRVDRILRRLPRRTEVIVLDPPRAGAGRRVIEQCAERRPRVIAYVACDPAALARDLAYAAEAGYAPVAVRAFDLFPMTHHVECVAILEPAPAALRDTDDRGRVIA